MKSGAQRQTIKRPRLEKLHDDGNVVIDASARFAQRRVQNLAQAANPLPVPDSSGPQAHLKTVASRPPLTIKPLKSRVVMDYRMAFILIRDGLDDTDGKRCLLFTVIPAPLDEDDDRSYLSPYLLRGWKALLQSPERPGLPGVIDMHTDPYTVFQNGMDRLDADNLDVVKVRTYGDLRFVSDPLSR
ncbi:MAG: hypothetical protein WC551_06345 [Patescibacteria group bacterium]